MNEREKKQEGEKSRKIAKEVLRETMHVTEAGKQRLCALDVLHRTSKKKKTVNGICKYTLRHWRSSLQITDVTEITCRPADRLRGDF